MKKCKKCQAEKNEAEFYKDRTTCRNCRRAYDAQYRKTEKSIFYQRRYQRSEKYREKQREYEKRKKGGSVQFRLSWLVRSRLFHAVRNGQKSGSAVRDLGCTIDELKTYLEGKFEAGMSWENRGYKGWHIDHIIPLASFDLTDREQFLKAVHYTNLQPLWAEKNFKKSNKIL